MSGEPPVNLRLIRADEAWRYSAAEGRPSHGRDVHIGIPDTGVVAHRSIRDAVRQSFVWDVIERDDEPHESPPPWPLRLWTFAAEGHGTAVASVAVGRGGPLGVAPEAQAVMVRCDYGPFQVVDSNITAAVNYLRRPRVRCDVICLAFGGWWLAGAREVIRGAIEEGMIVVAAAGNGGERPPLRSAVAWPALFPEVISVAACDLDGAPSRVSTRAASIDVAAPGEGIVVAGEPPDGLREMTGTSPAVAHVAGVAALWLAHHGRVELASRYGANRIQDVFRYVLSQAASAAGAWPPDTRAGSGVVDALNVLQVPLPEPPDVPYADEQLPYEGIAARLASLAVPLERLWNHPLRFRFVGGLYDSGRRGRERSALQKHVDFFDINGDGIVTIRETRRALALLGFGNPFTRPLMAFLLCAIVGWLTWRGPALTINADAVHRAAHFGSSGVFGRGGAFDQEAWDRVWGHDEDRDSRLSGAEITALLESRGRATPAVGPWRAWLGRRLRRFEFPVLLSAFGDRTVDGRMLDRERLRDFYGGGLFHDRARDGRR